MALNRKALKRWMKLNGHTQKTIAQAIGINPAGVSRHFKGGRVSPACIKKYIEIGIPQPIVFQLKGQI